MRGGLPPTRTRTRCRRSESECQPLWRAEAPRRHLRQVAGPDSTCAPARSQPGCGALPCREGHEAPRGWHCACALAPGQTHPPDSCTVRCGQARLPRSAACAVRSTCKRRWRRPVCRMLAARNLSELELGLVANLSIETPDEARKLVPTLEVRRQAPVCMGESLAGLGPSLLL